MTTEKYPKKVKSEAVPVLCWAPCHGDVSHAWLNTVHMGEWRYSSVHSWPQCYMDVTGRFHDPAASPMRWEPLLPIGWEVGGGKEKKFHHCTW